MESSAITWTLISNTVADRMIDLSLIHKLTPSRRLWRRNKAMNAAIKQFHGIKTYSQYVKIKTSVLRKLSDNRETDDNSSLTEDDYNTLYKSELSLTNYLMQASKNNQDYLYETDIDTNTDDTQNKKSVARKPKRKSRKSLNLGWQKVKRRKERNVSRAKVPNGNNNDTRSSSDIPAEITNDKFPLISPERPVTNLEYDVATPNRFKRETVVKENSAMHNSLAAQVTTQSDSMINERCQETSSRKEIDALETTVSCLNTFAQNTSKTLTNGTVDKKLCKIHPSIITSINQQKDSGIEEGTEEELSQDGSRDYVMGKNKLQQVEDNTLIGPSILVHRDNLKSLKNTDKDRDKVMECEGKAKKHKLQPTVTRTEIVSTKYKIVSCNEPVLDKYAELQEFRDREINKEEESGPDVEENIPSLTEKRLQQLRRLDLTADSDSSLSENEDTCNNVHKRKVWKDRIDEKGQDCCNIKMKDNTKVENEKLLKRHTSFLDNGDRPLKHSSKDNEASKANKTVGCKPNLVDELKHNNSREENIEELHREGAESEFIMHRANKKAVICNRRPCNLQELIEEEEKAEGRLVPETALPTFTFKEIDEDELFIMDVPTVVLASQLIGKKIVLTEKKLKLGKEKYKVEYKDTEKVSCVFASGKSRKPYKTVKIAPVARIVTRQKVASKSNAQMPNQCTYSYTNGV